MREQIEPLNELAYPDSGGYTGFSICIWNIKGKLLNEIHLMNLWGGFDPGRLLKNGNTADYLLEGRFFVFGNLPMLVVETGQDEEINSLGKGLFERWKPIMDSIIERESVLWKEEDRHGIHIDEILTADLLEKILSTHSRNRREN